MTLSWEDENLSISVHSLVWIDVVQVVAETVGVDETTGNQFIYFSKLAVFLYFRLKATATTNRTCVFHNETKFHSKSEMW